MFDNFSMLLRRDGQTQLVYKHAIFYCIWFYRSVVLNLETVKVKSKSVLKAGLR
jgi:sRNA-binding regulator protein Hfq